MHFGEYPLVVEDCVFGYKWYLSVQLTLAKGLVTTVGTQVGKRTGELGSFSGHRP